MKLDPLLSQLRNPLKKYNYSPAARTVAVAMKGVSSPALVANQTGLSESTVRRLWSGQDLHSSQVEGVKNNLRSKFYLISNDALDSITEDKLTKLDPYRLMLTAGIALDKARLIEGLSTENINFKSLSVTINAELATLREQRAALVRQLEGDSL